MMNFEEELNKRGITMKKYSEKDLEKAYIKGGITGIILTFVMIGIFAFILTIL